MSGRSLLRAGSLLILPFFLYLSSSSSPLPFSLFSRRHLPTSAHLQGTNIWEMQFEHFSATKERQTMLEKRGDKHAADLMLDKHVALPPIHKWPCDVRRSQVWKFKDKLDCACGRCCCLFAWRACLSIVWQNHSLRDDRRGMGALKRWERGEFSSEVKLWGSSDVRSRVGEACSGVQEFPEDVLAWETYETW